MASRRMILKTDIETPLWFRLSVRQRYLYWGLCLQADDDGIVPMYMIQGRILSYEDGASIDDVRQDLSDIEVAGYLSTYNDDGDKYILIAHWWDKQFIDKKIYKSTLFPKPPNYMNRPEDLTKRRNQSFYEPSSNVLDQNRIDETREDKNNLDEKRTDKPILEEARKDEDEPLPF